MVRPAPAPNPGAIDRTKVYYLFFDQTIDLAALGALRRELARLVEAGVTEIVLVIHSVGGLIDATYALYGFIRALPVRVRTHATGFVMSAATLLFLAGDDRTADHTARFLFHPTQVPLSGSATAQQLQDRLAQFGTNSEVARQIYRDRTTLSAAEMDRFMREEVFYTPEQALAAGVIERIEDLRIPGEGKARILFLD